MLTSERCDKPFPEINEFPKLMISTEGRIVLMTKEGSGTVVNSKRNDLGRHDDSWVMDAFEDYHGTITLGNN